MMQNLNNMNPNSNIKSTFSIHFNTEAQQINQTSSNNPQDKINDTAKRSFGEMHAETSTSTDTPEIKKARKLGEDLQNTPETSYECTLSCLDTEKQGMLAPSNKTPLKNFFKSIPEALCKSIFSFLNTNERSIFGRVNKISNHIMLKKLQDSSLIGVPIPLIASLRIKEIVQYQIDLYKYFELNAIKQAFNGTTLSSARHLNLSLQRVHVDWITKDNFSIQNPNKIICWPNFLTQSGNNIERLCQPISRMHLFKQMAADMPNLQILNLFSDEITGEQLNIFKNLSSLHTIQLDSPSNAALAELTPARFPLLEKIILTCPATTTDEGILHLANLKTLKNISIDQYGKGMTYLSLQGFSTLPSLTTLKLDCCEITNSDLAPLNRLTTLKSLSLCYIDTITDDAFRHLENLQLKHLALVATPRITGSLFKYLNPLRLRTLEFTEYEGTATDFVSIVALTALEHLDLYGCYRLQNHHLYPLASMASLRSLELVKCHDITDACVNYLRKSLPFTDIRDIIDYSEDDSAWEYEADEGDEGDVCSGIPNENEGDLRS